MACAKRHWLWLRKREEHIAWYKHRQKKMGAVSRKGTVSGVCPRRRSHGEQDRSWVDIGGWVDILDSSSTGWVESWLGFGMTSGNLADFQTDWSVALVKWKSWWCRSGCCCRRGHPPSVSELPRPSYKLSLTSSSSYDDDDVNFSFKSNLSNHFWGRTPSFYKQTLPHLTAISQ